MYAMIGILKKPKNMDSGTFRKWWLEEHAVQASKLPGLRRYYVHPLLHGFDMQKGEFTEDPEYQGVAYLWFDDEGRFAQMVVDGNRPCARGEGAREGARRAARLLSIALALLAVATQPALASTVRMVCLVVDLEGDGLRLGDRHYPVPFDVDGDGLRETVQWTAEEQREGFLWLDANHDGAMQSDELLGRRLATPDGPSRQAGWRALAPEAGARA